MTRIFDTLARRRWLAVGLAMGVEVAVLVPLGVADPERVVGAPSAIGTAIAGTVAVVFGPLAGAAVAIVGAVAFGAARGWGPGEVAALVVWPAIVVAAGLFARRVEQQRQGMAQLIAGEERERQRVAIELHEEIAQILSASLFALRRAEQAAGTPEAEHASAEARELIRSSIESIRGLAVDLRPRALDDFGLGPAIDRLVEGFSARTGIAVDVDTDIGDRLPAEVELAAYRAVEEVLAQLSAEPGDGNVRIVIERAPSEVQVAISHREAHPEARADRRGLELAGLRERMRLSGGRLAADSDRGGFAIRVALPLAPA